MSKRKIFLLLSLIVSIISLFLFRSGGNNTPTVETPEVVDPKINTLSNDFVTALLGVENVSLDITLLNSQIFKSLIPSGAVVDQNPSKGKIDPFAAISPNQEAQGGSLESSPREITLGQNEETAPIVNGSVNFSKITTSTALVAIVGIPQNNQVSVSILDSNNNLIPSPSFTYKLSTGEYSAVVTGLSTKTTYTVKVENPVEFASLKADFTTK